MGPESLLSHKVKGNDGKGLVPGPLRYNGFVHNSLIHKGEPSLEQLF